MKSQLNRIRIIFLLLISVLPAMSMVRLPSILASGMVLQQNTIVKVWGWADPGEKVVVEASWLVEKPEITAGPDGKWLVRIPTGPAGGPHSITITGTNTIVLTDILFGEVWVCSGQSNMEFTINMLGGWKNYKADRKELNSRDYSSIRLCQVLKSTSPVPVDTCSVSWSVADENSVANFSALAFFFGRTLNNWLHVPIGLISSNWGGTPAEAWTEGSFLEANPELGYFSQAPNGQTTDAGKPSRLFNAMINPLLNYSIRGVIWYQGESNIHEADLYRQLFSATIGSWRKAWGLGDFPFYFVQIAPYDYGEKFPSAAYLREAQMQCLSISNTGMVPTLDIGDVKNIHPKNKQEVGLRLGLCALANTYRQAGITYSVPGYEKLKHEGSRIRLFFSNAGVELTSSEKSPGGFTVSGPDGRFRVAEARIEDSTVVVWSDSVEIPVDVRYAFTNTGTASLFGQSGLPVVPFRTDTTSMLWRSVKISFSTDTSSRTTTATLTCLDKACSIRYTRDGSEPGPESPLYSTPLLINDTIPVIARVFKGEVASEISSRSGFEKHLGVGRNLSVTYPCSPRYKGGINLLLDGVRGSLDFWDGYWQGYQGVDFDGLVDLGKIMNVDSVSIGFLQSSASWIFLPINVSISVSSDGISFIGLPLHITSISPKNMNPLVENYSWEVASEIRFIRITAKNRGICPRWHPGKGGRAWIFTDEIVIK